MATSCNEGHSNGTQGKASSPQERGSWGLVLQEPVGSPSLDIFSSQLDAVLSEVICL